MYTKCFTLTLTTEKKIPVQDLMHCPSGWVVACRTVLTTTKVNDNNVCAALLPPAGCPIDAITQGQAHRVVIPLQYEQKVVDVCHDDIAQQVCRNSLNRCFNHRGRSPKCTARPLRHHVRRRFKRENKYGCGRTVSIVSFHQLFTNQNPVKGAIYT